MSLGHVNYQATTLVPEVPYQDHDPNPMHVQFQESRIQVFEPLCYRGSEDVTT